MDETGFQETETQACRRLGLQLQAHFTQREKQPNTLTPEYSRFTSSIRVGLRQFEAELQELQNKLNATYDSGTLSFQAIEQRRQELSTLQEQQRYLQNKYNKSANNQRDELFAGASSSTSGNAINTPEELKQRQIDLLEKQNESLDTLSQSLSRQKMLAQHLHYEVEDQTDILDNMANTMEHVEAGVTTETHNIAIVNRRDSTWGYWLVIIALLAAIFVVLFI